MARTKWRGQGSTSHKIVYKKGTGKLGISPMGHYKPGLKTAIVTKPKPKKKRGQKVWHKNGLDGKDWFTYK